MAWRRAKLYRCPPRFDCASYLSPSRNACNMTVVYRQHLNTRTEQSCCNPQTHQHASLEQPKLCPPSSLPSPTHQTTHATSIPLPPTLHDSRRRYSPVRHKIRPHLIQNLLHILQGKWQHRVYVIFFHLITSHTRGGKGRLNVRRRHK